MPNDYGEWYEIQCEDYFREKYHCPVKRTSLTNDGGKDLIIITPDGKIFVECKYWSNTPVGRPVIQKLHSAVITEGAIQGIVVTSGSFTKDAQDYISEFNLPIELLLFNPLNSPLDSNTVEGEPNTLSETKTKFPLLEDYKKYKNYYGHRDLTPIDYTTYPYSSSGHIKKTEPTFPMLQESSKKKKK